MPGSSKPNPFYFIQHEPGTTQSVRDTDGLDVEEVPVGSNQAAFAPRVLNPMVRKK